MSKHNSFEPGRRKTGSRWRISTLLSLFLGASVLGSVPAAWPQELKQLYIGTPARSVAWFPLFLAIKKRFFEKEGLLLRPVIMDTRIIVPALASKEIPYSTGLGSTMIGAAGGLPIKVIMILGGKTHLVLVTRPEIASPRDLRGRTVAVTRPGSDVHRMLVLVAKKFGMEPQDVKILGVGDLTNRVNALRRKIVDGAVLSVPYDYLVEKEGFRRLLYFKDFMDVPIIGLTTHDDRIRDRPEEVKKIITAIVRGIAYAKSRRQEAVPLLREFVGLESLEVAEKAYDAVKDMWPDNGLPSNQGLRNAITIADIAPTVSIDKLVNWGPLKEVLASSGGDPLLH